MRAKPLYSSNDKKVASPSGKGLYGMLTIKRRTKTTQQNAQQYRPDTLHEQHHFQPYTEEKIKAWHPLYKTLKNPTAFAQQSSEISFRPLPTSFSTLNSF